MKQVHHYCRAMAPLLLCNRIRIDDEKEAAMSSSPGLQKVLGPVQLWGIAVGLVISGEYFGWSYGWNTAGTPGLLVGTVLVAPMYTTFIFSFTELSTANPRSRDPFDHRQPALRPFPACLPRP